MKATVHFGDGTTVRHRPGLSITRLPCGAIVRARPNAHSAMSARALGYGDDVATMTMMHDYIHAAVCDRLGVPSHSLRMAAGLDHDLELAELEETAVCAVTRLVNAHRSAC